MEALSEGRKLLLITIMWSSSVRGGTDLDLVGEQDALFPGE